MATTIKIPNPIPALKIPVIALQELMRVEKNNNVVKGKNFDFTMIKNI